MFKTDEKERSLAASPGDERPTPTSDNTGPIISPSLFSPNRVPGAGEVGSAIILAQLTLLFILLLFYIAVRFRRRVPFDLVAAFDHAFLPETSDDGRL
jgi:hypothetical protein